MGFAVVRCRACSLPCPCRPLGPQRCARSFASGSVVLVHSAGSGGCRGAAAGRLAGQPSGLVVSRLRGCGVPFRAASQAGGWPRRARDRRDPRPGWLQVGAARLRETTRHAGRCKTPDMWRGSSLLWRGGRRVAAPAAGGAVIPFPFLLVLLRFHLEAGSGKAVWQRVQGRGSAEMGAKEKLSRQRRGTRKMPHPTGRSAPCDVGPDESPASTVPEQRNEVIAAPAKRGQRDSKAANKLRAHPGRCHDTPDVERFLDGHSSRT